MSGIVGTYHLDGSGADRHHLDQALHRIAHRGPDGRGLWLEGSVGFGHQMRYTTPESVGTTQPLEDTESGIVLTADARIDNRDELTRALGWTSRPPSDVSDGALILGAYKKWGRDGPAHLLGAFAFALWDPREHMLLCARDHMGVKPLFYVYEPGRLFAFGTEIKAVLKCSGAPRTINDARVADYLCRWGGDPETTFFESIRRLPPAHMMTVRADGVSVQRYWALDRHRELSLGSDAAYVEGFREVFSEAVRCRLRSVDKAGVMLSGGLDSSSVACVARALPESPCPLPTFSAIFPGLPQAEREVSDERRYLDALEAQGGLDPHRVSLDDVSPLEGIDQVLRHLDQPPYIGNLYLYRRLHAACQRAGVGVLLDGAEGDDAVSYGYGYLMELAAHRRWSAFNREAAALARRIDGLRSAVFHRFGASALREEYTGGEWLAFAHDTRTVARGLDLPYSDLLWTCALKPSIPAPVRRLWRKWKSRGSNGDRPSNSTVMARQELLARTDFERRRERFERQRQLVDYTAREAHWHALHGGAGDIATVLEEVDGLAAMHGLEQRHPFYDVRVLSYCLALPPDQKLRDGWTRSILRRAIGDLPAEIRTRVDKADLSFNFRRNLSELEDSRLRQLIEEAPDEWANYVNVDAVRTAYRQGRVIDMWPALILARWLKAQRGQERDRT